MNNYHNSGYSIAGQRQRFEQAIKIFKDKEGFSMLDLGCGQGDFLEYICNRGVYPKKYLGVDMDHVPIDKAAKRGFGDQFKFESRAIDSGDMGKFSFPKYDYVFMLGTITYPPKGTREDQLQWIINMCESAWRVCKKGLCINFPSELVDASYLDGSICYVSPNAVVLFAEDKTKRFSLSHDYANHDCTLLMWRR